MSQAQINRRTNGSQGIANDGNQESNVLERKEQQTCMERKQIKTRSKLLN